MASYLRTGPAIWPCDARSVGLSGAVHQSTVRLEGAPFAVFMWTLQGKGYVKAPDKRFLLQKGMVFIIPPGIPHEYGAHGKPAEWQVEWFTLDGVLCADYLKALGMEKLIVRDIGAPSEALFQRLMQSIQEPGIQGSMERAQYAIRIVHETHARINKLLRSVTSPRFKELMEHARQKISYELNVDYLARQSGLTRSHFSRTFASETGMSPLRFVMEIKLAKARTLLLDSDSSVKEIARECGFFDTAHFSRQFASFTGLTPAAFRCQPPMD